MFRRWFQGASALVILAAALLAAADTRADTGAGESTDSRWTFYGDLRERATYVSAIDFDESDPDAGWFWTQRVRFTADYDDRQRWAGRITFLSALQEGIEDSPIHNNDLDFAEAWLRLGDDRLSLLGGRQEVALGSQRLVGTRDGTNVRRNWDGLRAVWRSGRWRADALALQLVDVETKGIFNDTSDDDRVLGGAYATADLGQAGLDLYWLYAGFDDRLTIEGVADQRRHSLGARYFGERGPVFWNWEAIVQAGEHGDQDIEAWTLATNTGYRFDGAMSPEVMLSLNVSSGDSERDDGKLETFDALYPRGNYFSELAQFGPLNFFNINPYLTIEPAEGLVMSFDVNFFWRYDTNDGVYGPAGNLIRGPEGSDERFVNTAFSASIDWQVSRHVSLGLSLTRSRPEAFLEETGPADTANFAEFTLLVSY